MADDGDGEFVDEIVDSAGLRSPIECRSVPVQDVRFADRIITVTAAPYDVETVVPYRGRMVRESFAPGSFDGVERRAARVKVFRDHPPPTGPVGRAAALHPSRKEGLVAELKISKTPLGDETLELADDGVLDASVGFAIMSNGEQWLENRALRRVTRAFLDHIALPPQGQYDEAAGVLSVRRRELVTPGAPRVSTPNLDAWRLEQVTRRLNGGR
jgi:phage head maturation protease